MGKTSAAAAATILLNLCASSHGQEMPPMARKIDNNNNKNNPRRSLRSGMVGDDFLKEGEAESEHFHTTISTTGKKAVPQQQNSFYDLDAFSAKEVSLQN